MGVALALGSCAMLAGCAGGSAPDAGPTPPPGVTASVYQPRPDIPAARMAIQVHNGGDAPVDVVAATLHTEVFAEAASWADDGATVLAGRALDLRIDIPELRCGDPAEPPRVELTFDDGGTLTVEADDPYDLLPRFADEACLAEAVGDVVALGEVRLEYAGGAVPATLVVPATPTGAGGAVVVDAALSTTLLQPADATGTGTSELPLGIALGDGGAAEVRVPLVPNRCDAHALAEDKIGTGIPLLVTAGGVERGRLVLPAGDELRAAMYAFFTEYCGL